MHLRSFAIAGLVAASVVLTACGSDSGSSAVDSAGSAAYLKAIKVVGTSYSNDDAAIEAGKQACSDLKASKSVSDVLASLKAEAGGEAQAMTVMGAAIGAFCPDQQTKLIPTTVPTG